MALRGRKLRGEKRTQEIFLLIQTYLALFVTMWKKQILPQGLSEFKKKIGSNHTFFEIIELKFGNKMPYIPYWTHFLSPSPLVFLTILIDTFFVPMSY